MKRLALIAIILMGLTVASTAAATPSSSAWVVLDSGRQGDYFWSVRARVSGGAAEAGALSDARRPCLMIGTKWERSPFSYGRSRYRACADAPGRLVATTPPLIASGAVVDGGPNPEMTAVGMIVASKVDRVRITFADGTTETVPTERPTPDQSRTAGLGSVGYAAFSVRGGWCPERLATESGSGRTLWGGGVEVGAC